jgi:hypothetical protein
LRWKGLVTLTAEATSYSSLFGNGSRPCYCKSEPAQRSANTGSFHPCRATKQLSKRNCRAIKLSVFKGREAKLNGAIFYVLSQEAPLAVWNILGRIKDAPGLKRTKYAVISLRVKALETQGYLRRAGTRDKKQGGQTNLYELTAQAQLAMALRNKTMDDIISKLNEDTALTMLSLIFSTQCVI